MIKVVVVPAEDQRTAVEPLFLFLGGPGESGTSRAAALVSYFTPFLKTRDFVLIDQRGTGKSSPLNFPLYDSSTLQTYFGPFFPPESVRRGRIKLETNADVRFYTTTNSVEDFEEIRKALGYGKINLYGISYGTRVALVYLRRYPESIRAAILNGITPTDERVDMNVPQYFQEALYGVLHECLQDEKCRNAFPKIKEE